MKYKSFLIIILMVLYATILSAQIPIGPTVPSGPFEQLVINEVSNGTTYKEEFVEFVAVCNGRGAGPTVDIRSWIFDDNSGLTDVCKDDLGIAEGHARFSEDSQWACVPCGAIIVVYNSSDPNPSLPPDDPSDADGDLVYIVPSTSSLVTHHNTAPDKDDCLSYPPLSDSGYDFNKLDWGRIALNNFTDLMQLVAPNTLQPTHIIAYGRDTSSLQFLPNNYNKAIFLDVTANGSNVGRGLTFRMTNATNNDYALASNWEYQQADTHDTPGLPNTAKNYQWIENYRNRGIGNPQIWSNYQLDCGGDGYLTHTFQSDVTSSAYSYLWDFGDGNTGSTASPSHTYNAPGQYTVTLTLTNGSTGCPIRTTEVVQVFGFGFGCGN